MSVSDDPKRRFVKLVSNRFPTTWRSDILGRAQPNREPYTALARRASTTASNFA